MTSSSQQSSQTWHCQTTTYMANQNFRTGMALRNLALPNHRTLYCPISGSGTAQFGTAKLPYVALPNLALTNYRRTAEFGSASLVAPHNFRRPTWYSWIRHCQPTVRGTAKCPYVAQPNLALQNYFTWQSRISVRGTASLAVPNLVVPRTEIW